MDAVPEVEGGGVDDNVTGQREGLCSEQHSEREIQRSVEQRGKWWQWKKSKGRIYTSILNVKHLFIYKPVVDSTGSEVCVEDSDDSRCCVSQNGIINDIQEVDQL